MGLVKRIPAGIRAVCLPSIRAGAAKAKKNQLSEFGAVAGYGGEVGVIEQVIAGEHRKNLAWINAQFERLPHSFRPSVGARYVRDYHSGQGAFRRVNLGLLEAVDALGGCRVDVAGGEDALRAFAKERSGECWRVVAMARDADLCLKLMRNVALRYEISPPDQHNVTPRGQRARLLCEHWWRRAVRRYVARRVEGAAIKLGLVHRRAEVYASNETCNRRRGQKIRNRALLETVIATNEAGDSYSLKELSDMGVSNPSIRRMELMTRLAGFDEVAKFNGHAGEFYTLTAPSKYHARESIGGQENQKYNGATPRDTQGYLNGVWQRLRAALHRRGIGIYGFRVCEPHHDGTPHWHMVIFMRPEHVETVREIFRRYALAEDGAERGADKHRFTYQAIDRRKGSAAGYLAKYISKNIDGFGVGEDWEAAAGGDDAKDCAKRVDAWASAWGIRQFQQIGGAPVTVWRELRKLGADYDAGGDLLLAKFLEVVNAASWAGYVNLQGGPFARRSELTAKVWRRGAEDIETGEIRINRYGEMAADTVRGVVVWGEPVETRLHDWFFSRSGAAAPPWSSVNNCTEVGGYGCERESGEDAAGSERGAEFAWGDVDPGEFPWGGGKYGTADSGNGGGNRNFERERVSHG